jgi:hypothetical protein
MKNGGFEMLVNFVRESFKVSWGGKNLSAIKELDSMTKEMKIPSRSGSGIVNSLSVSCLIYTDTSRPYLLIITLIKLNYIVINLQKFC